MGFTREQHIKLGAELVEMEGRICKAIDDGLKVYSVNGKEVMAMERARRAIETLRMVMGDAADREPHHRDREMYFAYSPLPGENQGA